MPDVRVITGDCREVLASLPAGEFHTCVTSPPYFGLRDYGHDGQIGLEPTPDDFVAALVAVFREVKRVLRDDGTVWLNLGDSYAGSWGAQGRGGPPSEKSTLAGNGHVGGGPKVKNLSRVQIDQHPQRQTQTGTIRQPGLKSKDLIGIPWRVAFALQADGWYLRQDIIWSKPNPMPESVRDRCTKAHEYLFLLSKRPSYYYDAAAIAEESVIGAGAVRNITPGKKGQASTRNDADRFGVVNDGTRNRRSVWTVATQPFSGAHFATFPPALIEPCILAGCPAECCAACGAPYERQVERTAMVLDRSERTHEKGRTRSSGTMLEPPTCKTLGFAPSCGCNAGTAPGRVLDPFGGAGTTGLVADRLQRSATLIELNPAYADMARARIRSDAPLFAGAAE